MLMLLAALTVIGIVIAAVLSSIARGLDKSRRYPAAAFFSISALIVGLLPLWVVFALACFFVYGALIQPIISQGH